MDSLKRAIRGGLCQFGLGRRLVYSLSLCSYLEEKGWLQSRSRSLPLDTAGSPMPWYTYPFIAFIGPRVHAGMSVFEYGSGNSTLWWAARVSLVLACEHDRSWYERTKVKLPQNAEYIFCPLNTDGRYSEMCVSCGSKYDCIVIDGRARNECAKHSIKALKEDGVIIWDNSDRAKYQEGYDFLADAGFKRLDFWGLGPINPYEWCTSVFYREDNCLGI